ncbi:unnamed protein product [Arctogadus glacialis]
MQSQMLSGTSICAHYGRTQTHTHTHTHTHTVVNTVVCCTFTRCVCEYIEIYTHTSYTHTHTHQAISTNAYTNRHLFTMVMRCSRE